MDPGTCPTRWQRAREDVSDFQKREIGVPVVAGAATVGVMAIEGFPAATVVAFALPAGVLIATALLWIALRFYWAWLQAPMRMLADDVSEIRELVRAGDHVNEQPVDPTREQVRAALAAGHQLAEALREHERQVQLRKTFPQMHGLLSRIESLRDQIAAIPGSEPLNIEPLRMPIRAGDLRVAIEQFQRPLQALAAEHGETYRAVPPPAPLTDRERLDSLLVSCNHLRNWDEYEVAAWTSGVFMLVDRHVPARSDEVRKAAAGLPDPESLRRVIEILDEVGRRLGPSD